jgi:hypothetical protein
MVGRISSAPARRWYGPILISVIVAGVGLATAATAQVSPPTADMAVTSLTTSATTAARGTVVTFREVIKNNGPQTVEMDTGPQISGGVLVDEVCQGVSPDTPFCEYGDVAPGQRLVSKFKIKVTASHGRLVVKGGVFSEEAVLDTNPFNQYLTRSVPITAHHSRVAGRFSRSS